MPTTKKVTTVKTEISKVSKVPSVSKGKTEKVEAVILSEAEGSVKTKGIASSPKAAAPRNDVKRGGFSVPVYSLLGKESGTLDLPKSIFGVEVNKALLSQALRVYINNLKGHHSNTKTRGEVEGSTRKIYKQKGTGRARHGGITAPIFVGGGIALGPKYRKVTLDLPKKMKQAALISAFSQKLLDKDIIALSGLEKATGKTSEIAKFIKAIGKKSVLIVADKSHDMARRAAQNIKGVSLISADDINTFEVIKAQSLILTKEAVAGLEARIMKQEVSKEKKGEK